MAATTAEAEDQKKMAEQTFSPPKWKTQRESPDNNVVITPCEPIPMMLMEVRAPWEPSSFVEESERKNVFLELRDPTVRAFLQAQEDA